MNKGLSGWLSPEGTFIPVNYGEHDEVARSLEQANLSESKYNKEINFSLVHGERLFELLGYIKFVCRRTVASDIINDSYVFFPQQFGFRYHITDKQIDWIDKNFDNMTVLQRKYTKQYLHYACKYDSL